MKCQMSNTPNFYIGKSWIITLKTKRPQLQSHKVSSYQTLVRAPDAFIIQQFMKCYQSLVSVPISSFKNTLNQKYLQSFVRFTSMEVISIYCVFLPMFGNLRLYEIHQTLLSYQVLSMQIRLVNNLR